MRTTIIVGACMALMGCQGADTGKHYDSADCYALYDMFAGHPKLVSGCREYPTHQAAFEARQRRAAENLWPFQERFDEAMAQWLSRNPMPERHGR